MAPGDSQVLARKTWMDVAASPDHILIMAVGSCEQHGPHLPLGTDTLIAESLCERACDLRNDLVMGPTISLGSSGEHQDFPGTLSIGTEVLAALLTEVVRSARRSFQGVVFVSGHGGNASALATTEKLARHEGDALCCFSPTIEGGDAHAGRSETSLLLWLWPEGVGEFEGITGQVAPLSEIMESLREHGVKSVSDNGVLGDPRGASRKEGEALFATLTSQLLITIEKRFDQ